MPREVFLGPHLFITGLAPGELAFEVLGETMSPLFASEVGQILVPHQRETDPRKFRASSCLARDIHSEHWEPITSKQMEAELEWLKTLHAEDINFLRARGATVQVCWGLVLSY